MQLNLLFILPSLRRGGAETQLVTLANNLALQNFNIHIACFDEDTHQIDKLSSYVKFHHFPRTKKFDRKVIAKLSHIVESEKIDFIHCTLQISLFYGWAAKLAAKRKAKLLVTVHTTINFDFRAELFDWVLYQWIMRQCDSIIFVCEEQKKYWERKWGFIKRKGVTIHNGIDPIFFSTELDGINASAAKNFRKTHDIANDAKIIAHIAGFRREKGHAILVNAFKNIAPSNTDAIIVFAGDGLLRSEIEALCKQTGLNQRVRFIGNVSDVRPLLANSYIAVIASTAVETFSIAMLEAMAMGVPLVATDIGGTREAVIPGETGWLLEPGNMDALARVLAEALSNEDDRDRMATSCREKVLNNFTVEKMTAGYANLFLNMQPASHEVEDAMDAPR